MTDEIPKGAMEIPEFVYSIPEDADDGTKLYMRAQIVIQATFHAFGDPKAKPGTMTLASDELINVLSFATGMLIATDPNLKTKRDLRLMADDVGKYIRKAAEVLQGDETAKLFMQAIGFTRPTTN